MEPRELMSRITIYEGSKIASFPFRMSSFWEHRSITWVKGEVFWRKQGGVTHLAFLNRLTRVQDHLHYTILVLVWVLNPKLDSFHMAPVCAPSLPLSVLRVFYLEGVWLTAVFSLVCQPAPARKGRNDTGVKCIKVFVSCKLSFKGQKNDTFLWYCAKFRTVF